MATLIEAPITERDGVLLITGTRVTLDTVIESFHNGATSEDIALHYPSLELVVVYEVIAYYLRHRVELDAYLERSKAESTALRFKTEAQHDPTGIRTVLREKYASRFGSSPDANLAAEQRERRGWDELDVKLLGG